MASTEVERASAVDVADVPSANWGWSKINHRNWRVVGLLSFGLLLMFLDGNHVGHVENNFLIDAPAGMTLQLVCMFGACATSGC